MGKGFGQSKWQYIISDVDFKPKNYKDGNVFLYGNRKDSMIFDDTIMAEGINGLKASGFLGIPGQWKARISTGGNILQKTLFLEGLK